MVEEDPLEEAVFYANLMLGAERDDDKSLSRKKHHWGRRRSTGRQEDPLMFCRRCGKEATKSQIKERRVGYCSG